MEKETKRKVIHISMGFLTILLGFFPRWLAIIAVLVALFFVLVIARPSVWKLGFESMASRDEDQTSGFLYGPTLYVIMVLILVIFFDLRVAGAIFAIMAFGDGFANVIGTRFGLHRYERFQNKSIEGFLAFIIFSFITSVPVFFWISLNPNPDTIAWIPFLLIKEVLYPTQIIFMCLFISIVAAIIEFTTSKYLNDNVSVPMIGGILLTFFLKF